MARTAKKRQSTKNLQAQTLKNAHRTGMPWTDDEIGEVINSIERDDTTFDLAMRIGRTLYSTSSARRNVGFVMRHRAVFRNVL